MGSVDTPGIVVGLVTPVYEVINRKSLVKYLAYVLRIYSFLSVGMVQFFI